MVAIPKFLLASTALTALQPGQVLQHVTRSIDVSTPPAAHVVEHAPRAAATPDKLMAVYNKVIDLASIFVNPLPPHDIDNDKFTSVKGPVIQANFPDPAILYVDGMSYAYATRDKNKPANERAHVQIATSTDNVTWTVLSKDAMPTLGNWETGSSVWAPSVVQLDNGKFVLYYSDEIKTAIGHHCIGVATSDSPEGPFVPQDEVFTCPDPKTEGGAIDAAGFHDPSTNKRYVVYKVDGNSLGHGGACSNTVQPIMPTPLMLQEVSATDGVTRVGDAWELIDRDAHDGPLIEAPALHRSSEGIYFLFYSSNCFVTPLYDVEYATATSLKGPWQKLHSRLLGSGDGPNSNLVGPGGLDIINDGTSAVFHGILNMENSPTYASEIEDDAEANHEKVNAAAQQAPLMRGMYTAQITFNGRTASL